MTSIGADSDKPATPLAAAAKTNLAKWLAMVALICVHWGSSF
jgi:hypothetical protein